MLAPEAKSRPGTIPEELKALPQWLCWKLAKRKGKTTKVPISPHGGKGKSTNPSTWGTLEEALAHARQHPEITGVGFVFSKEDPYCGVDLDGCRDSETGELAAWAREIVGEIDSYTELSPSGTGLHIIVRGQLPPGRRGWGEGNFLADAGRFFTMTGELLEGAPTEIEDRQEELGALHRQLFPPQPAAGATRNGHPATNPPELPDDELLERARTAKNGARFARLFAGDHSGYASDSEADLALCSMLAFWTGDEGQIDRLFRQSGLYREKWERADYRERTIRKAVENRAERYAGAVSKTGALAAPAPETNGHAPDAGGAPVLPTLPQGTLFTDVGNARRFFDADGPDLRHCWPWGKWFVWDGRRWTVDRTGEVHRRAQAVAVSIFQEAADFGRAGHHELSQKLNKHAIRSQSATSIENMVKLARPDAPVLPEQLDRDPWRLNVENGTIDLKTGKFREHRREDLITKLAPVAHDPGAKAPVWEATLERILPDPEVRAYFKRLVGYASTGDVSEHVLPVLYGTGANGKSTVLNTLLSVLGDYGMQAPPDLLISKRDAHPTELADLHGQRFVASIEVEDGRRFAESLVKQLTGGDRIKARRMREDFWEFDPTHKIIMAVNHKPVIRGTDLGIWRRIHLIPFTETIPPEEQDKKLPEKLRAEMPGILAWAVEGCLEWQRAGLKPPEAVKAATEEYRQEMDTLAAFISERCVKGPNQNVQAKLLYNAYKDWCEENGERYENNNTFSRQLTERGYERDRDKKHVRYYGLALRSEDDDPGGLLTPPPEPPEDDAPPLGDRDAPPPPASRTSERKPASRAREEAAPAPRKGAVSAPEGPGRALLPDGPSEALRNDPVGSSRPSVAPSPAPGEPTEEVPPEVTRPESANGPREKADNDAEDIGVRAREELRKKWAVGQLALIRSGRENLKNPLANAIACELFNAPHRWREVLPFVEQAVAEERGNDGR